MPGFKQLECYGYIPDGEDLITCFSISTQHSSVADRQTDRQKCHSLVLRLYNEKITAQDSHSLRFALTVCKSPCGRLSDIATMTQYRQATSFDSRQVVDDIRKNIWQNLLFSGKCHSGHLLHFRSESFGSRGIK